jgi:hypothetical protein
MERAMGIENTARKTIIMWNQSVIDLPERCVGFLCEKQRYTGQRQPMPASKVVAATVNEMPQ